MSENSKSCLKKVLKSETIKKISRNKQEVGRILKIKQKQKIMRKESKLTLKRKKQAGGGGGGKELFNNSPFHEP